MQQPPPFVLPPDGWRARVRGLLAGLGLQARAVGVVALAALALAAVVWVRGTPTAEPPLWTPPDGTAGAGVPAPGPAAVPAAGGVAAGPAGGASGPFGSPPAGQGGIAVHVAGRVRRPGVVLLPAGSRVADALAAAGGPASGADLDRLNLARRLADGEQVLVTRKGEQPPPVAAGGGASGAAPATGGAATPAAKLDLNTATAEQLETLPGVGPVTAERIVAHRARAPFRSVQDLLQVEGIGERRFESLRDLVTVG